MSARVVSLPPHRFGEAFRLGAGLEALGLLLQSPPEGGSLESLPEPFVRLPDSGGVATTLVGRTAEGVGESRLVGVLMRSDAEAGGHSAAAGDRWFLELTRSLCTLARSATGAAGEAPAAGSADPEPQLLPPLWYCKRRQLVFVPPCPACGEALAECREADALVAAGLEPRDRSPRRYIHCPACGGGEEGPRFYSLGGGPDHRPQVGDRWALAAGFRQRVEASRDAGNPCFPCQGCTFSHGCYPEGDGTAEGEARSLLMPLTFYGGGAWPLEFLPLGYDAASDLLGGRPAAELQTPWEPLPLPGTAQGDAREGFLFPAEGDPRRPVESLLLKLTLFEQLCAGVESVHDSLARPHLHLNPGTGRVSLGGRGGAAPRFWNSHCQPVGLDAAWPVRDEELGGELSPPARFDLTYSHPGVAACSGREEWQPARFAVKAVEDDPSGGCVVEGLLDTERIRPGEAGPADTFQIALGEGLGFRTELILACACGGGAGGGIALRAAPVLLDAADRERLASLRALPQVEVRFTVARRYGPECDLFSLGMLLFRSLLVNRAQTMDQVSQRCRSIASELSQLPGAHDAGSGTESLPAELDRRLADPVFDPGNLLWDSLPAGAAPVSVQLWREVLVLGFRLLTGIDGFSFLPAGAAVGPVDGAPVARVRAELRRLLDSVRQGLFTWQPEVEEDIRGVLTGLVDDPAWLDRVLSPGTALDRPVVAEAPAPPEAAPQAPVPPEPGLDETVILRPGEMAAAMSSARPPADSGPAAGEPAGPALEETMILKRPAAGAVPGAAPPSPAAAEGAGGFDETVILRPGQGEAPSAPPTEPPAGHEPQAPQGEDLEKTIILRRGGTPEKK